MEAMESTNNTSTFIADVFERLDASFIRYKSIERVLHITILHLKPSMQWRYLVLLFALFFFSSAHASAALKPYPQIPVAPTVFSTGNTFYVSKDIGKDSYLQKKAMNPLTPWATINRGVSMLKAGDTLIILAAKSAYNERVECDRSGNEKNWITIKGAEGQRPTVASFVLGKRAKYISLSNLQVMPDTEGKYLERGLVYLDRGVEHFLIEGIEIDGKGSALWGLQLGKDAIDKNKVSQGYIRNVVVHHTVGYGVYIENGTENVVFDHVTSRNSLKDDGFSGRANPWERDSRNKNLYFVDSKAYDNAGDGFDIGADETQYMARCFSYRNGNAGFKVWGGVENGGDIWLVNNVAFNNGHTAIAIKNISEANVFILHNTFVENEKLGGGVEVTTVSTTGSGSDPKDIKMGVPHLFIYNNLIVSRTKGGIPVFAFYNKDTKVIGSNCNLFAGLTRSNLLCQLRDARMRVVGKFSVNGGEDIVHDTEQSLVACGYADELAEAQSLINFGVKIDALGFKKASNNDYQLTSTSPGVNRGCALGVKVDIKNNKRNIDAPNIGAFEYIPENTDQ